MTLTLGFVFICGCYVNRCFVSVSDGTRDCLGVTEVDYCGIFVLDNLKIMRGISDLSMS